MHYLCLLAVLLTLPVTATAQRRDDRRSNDRASDEHRTDQRTSGWGASPSNHRAPWWEQRQTPWWERQNKPSWESPKAPAPWQTLRPVRTLLDRDREQRPHDQFGDGGHRGSRRNSGVNVIVVPQYRFFPNTLPGTTQFVVTPPPPAQVVAQTAPEPLPAAGLLQLDVEPRVQLQIYIDGVFVGTPADLGDELELTAGTRRIELRARGYKTLTFSAAIQEGRSISYRGVLERDETAPPPPAPVVVPVDGAQGKRPPDTPGGTKMYLIPGCYLGNVAPKAEQLRSGCDISKLTTFTP